MAAAFTRRPQVPPVVLLNQLVIFPDSSTEEGGLGGLGTVFGKLLAREDSRERFRKTASKCHDSLPDGFTVRVAWSVLTPA